MPGKVTRNFVFQRAGGCCEPVNDTDESPPEAAPRKYASRPGRSCPLSAWFYLEFGLAERIRVVPRRKSFRPLTCSNGRLDFFI